MEILKYSEINLQETVKRSEQDVNNVLGTGERLHRYPIGPGREERGLRRRRALQHRALGSWAHLATDHAHLRRRGRHHPVPAREGLGKH